MADKNKSGDFYNRPEKLGAWDGFKQFLWNSETSQFMGRTSGSWGRILLFYLIFYAALSAFFVGMWFIFASTLKDHRPKYELRESLIGANPGLGFRPMPLESNVESTLIWYQKNNESSTKYWVEEVSRFLDNFEPVETNLTDAEKKERDEIKENRVNCKTRTPAGIETCRFNMDAFGDCTLAKKFGYPEGKPCIFLKLNKIYNWLPSFYTREEELPAYMPESLKTEIKKTDYNQNFVWVSCQGENPADLENLGSSSSIKYFSLGGKPGFLGNFFPFTNVKGYLQPLVAVQFTGVKTGVLINIECKAWARGLEHDRIERRGSVHFELMIDEPTKENSNKKQ